MACYHHVIDDHYHYSTAEITDLLLCHGGYAMRLAIAFYISLLSLLLIFNLPSISVAGSNFSSKPQTEKKKLTNPPKFLPHQK